MLIELFPVGVIAFWLLFLLLIVLCWFMHWWGGYKYRKKYKNLKKRFCSHDEMIDIDVKNISICLTCGYVRKIPKSGEYNRSALTIEDIKGKEVTNGK